MGEEKITKIKDYVFATVFLHSKRENSSLEEQRKGTRDTYSLEPNPEVFKKVRTELKKIGFNIVSQGSFSFTIHSTKNHFENVFGIKLDQKEFPIFEGKDHPTTKFYVAEKEIKIPDNLKNLIKRIALPKHRYLC